MLWPARPPLKERLFGADRKRRLCGVVAWRASAPGFAEFAWLSYASEARGSAAILYWPTPTRVIEPLRGRTVSKAFEAAHLLEVALDVGETSAGGGPLHPSLVPKSASARPHARPNADRRRAGAAFSATCL